MINTSTLTYDSGNETYDKDEAESVVSCGNCGAIIEDEEVRRSILTNIGEL